ncbi:MAG: DUF2079 domain-containing protein [Thermoplasmata archaeon]
MSLGDGGTYTERTGETSGDRLMRAETREGATPSSSEPSTEDATPEGTRFPSADRSRGLGSWLRLRVRGFTAAFTSRENRWALLFLVVAVVSFTIFVGWVTELRYWSFETFAWDLGNYNQAFFTALSPPHVFYYTADTPAGTNGYLFASHFSPFFYLLLPFYALNPGPPTLLLLQAAGLALGAVPLFLLARLRLGSVPWSLFLAGLYLLTPLTIGTAWYDFHPEAFVPVTSLTIFYFMARRSFWPFVVSWVLALSVIETAAAFLMVFAAVVALSAVWKLRKGAGAPARTDLTLAIIGLGLAILWLFLSFLVVGGLGTAGSTFGATYSTDWSILGASTIYDVYPQALLHPAAVVSALSYGSSVKAGYVAFLFGSFAFLPILGERRYLAMTVAWLGLAVLSNDGPFYRLSDQYLAYSLAPLAAATIGGIEWIRRRNLSAARPSARPNARPPRRVRLTTQTAVVVLVVALGATTALGSPLLPQPVLSFEIPHGVPTVSQHDQLLHQVIALVPASATILTTRNLFPEVSSRHNALVVPVSTYFAGNLTFEGVLGRYVNESQYVLIDYHVDYEDAIIVHQFADLSGFGLRAAVDGAYLYERGWSVAPSWFVPYVLTVSPNSLAPTGNCSLGTALLCPPPRSPNGTAWSGPGTDALPPGGYHVTVRLSVSSTEPGPQVNVTAVQDPIALLIQVINPSATGRDYDFQLVAINEAGYGLGYGQLVTNGSVSNEITNVSFGFMWQGPGFLQLTGTIYSAGSTVWLYGMTVSQQTPYG